MSSAVMQFASNYTIKIVTQAVVNHRPTETIVESVIKAVVQSASPTLLSVMDVDTTMKFFQVHTTNTSVKENDIMIIDGVEYRLIKGRDFKAFGYSEFLAEEIKQ